MLIQQSIATQYGILPEQQGELPYHEWEKLVSGLMDTTPLGRVVAIRAERDRDTIARMPPWQHRLRREWQAFRARQMQRKDPEEVARQMAGLEQMIAKAFGGGSGDRR